MKKHILIILLLVIFITPETIANSDTANITVVFQNNKNAEKNIYLTFDNKSQALHSFDTSVTGSIVDNTFGHTIHLNRPVTYTLFY